jgi:hypothetical protein
MNEMLPYAMIIDTRNTNCIVKVSEVIYVRRLVGGPSESRHAGKTICDTRTIAGLAKFKAFKTLIAPRAEVCSWGTLLTFAVNEL